MKLQGFLVACSAWLVMATSTLAAEQFGDISVSPQSISSGETYHGYREFRILVENHSAKNEHQVRLIFPEKSFNYGHSISRISRTVSLAPGARSLVPIWQPPLMLSGNGMLRVIVDGNDEGTVRMPGGNHMNRPGGPYSGAVIPATVLVSRDISFDEMTRLLRVDDHGFTPAMATGANDSGASTRGLVHSAWSPNNSSSGPHWLELDYDRPVQTDRVRLFDTMGASYQGELILIGTSGTNLATVSFPSSGPGYPGNARELTFPVSSEPVKTLRFQFGSTYAGMISVDAVELVETNGTAQWATAARASSHTTAASLPHIAGGQMIGSTRAEFPAHEWSESWLAYSGFDAVAVSGNDLRTMPPGVQNALWRYTECGGNLLVFGVTAAPEPWRSAPRNALEDGFSVDAGFGRCFVFKSVAGDLHAADVKTLTDEIGFTRLSWQSLPDENLANSGFTVVENVRIPVRGIVIIMLAFVITIGPVNIIYLSRTNRRTWLLWTIPAISVVTSLLVFAYSLLREGVTSDVRTEGLTLLDQANRRATTKGTTAFYCPLTPSGLVFSSDTEVTPLVGTWDTRRGNAREMDWTQAQQLQRGWVSARVPAHFSVRKSETRRERIQLDRTGSQLTIVNGLGAPVRSLWLADSAGKIYSATNVAAGQKVELVASNALPAKKRAQTYRALSQKLGYYGSVNRLLETDPEFLLIPDSYIAELDENPFIENGLGSKAKSARTQARAVVYGLLEPSAQP